MDLGKSDTKGRFIYIQDSSNSSSHFDLVSLPLFLEATEPGEPVSEPVSSLNSTWTDKQSSHFSTEKEIRVNATFFSSYNHMFEMMVKWRWNPSKLVICKWWTD